MVSDVAVLAMIAMVVVVSANLSNVVLLPRLGPKPLVTAGMLLAAGSLAWLTGIGVHSSYAATVLGPADEDHRPHQRRRPHERDDPPSGDYDVCAVVPLDVPDSGASIRSWRPGSLREDSTGSDFPVRAAHTVRGTSGLTASGESTCKTGVDDGDRSTA